MRIKELPPQTDASDASVQYPPPVFDRQLDLLLAARCSQE
uniref:Uncharacterized protein n=1 Tax=Setaria italica TaxID=4555 RepID=K3XTZ3_SETIT